MQGVDQGWGYIRLLGYLLPGEFTEAWGTREIAYASHGILIFTLCT